MLIEEGVYSARAEMGRAKGTDQDSRDKYWETCALTKEESWDQKLVAVLWAACLERGEGWAI